MLTFCHCKLPNRPIFQFISGEKTEILNDVVQNLTVLSRGRCTYAGLYKVIQKEVCESTFTWRPKSRHLSEKKFQFSRDFWNFGNDFSDAKNYFSQVQRYFYSYIITAYFFQAEDAWFLYLKLIFRVLEH